MKKHRVDYSLAGMCQCFNVSRSGLLHVAATKAQSTASATTGTG